MLFVYMINKMCVYTSSIPSITNINIRYLACHIIGETFNKHDSTIAVTNDNKLLYWIRAK